MTTLTRGTQILYVPMHAHDDTNHPDCEPGFVTSVCGDMAFCHYWNKQSPTELRTKANGEATLREALVERWSVPQAQVAAALAAIDAETQEKSEALNSWLAAQVAAALAAIGAEMQESEALHPRLAAREGAADAKAE